MAGEQQKKPNTNAVELDEEALDKVQGGATKPLVGDVLRGTTTTNFAESGKKQDG